MKRMISIAVLLLSMLAVFSVNASAKDKITAVLDKTAYTYSGEAKTPAVTVKSSSGTKLKRGKDYAVTYSSGRKNVGRYSVTVSLKGKYSGKIKKTFTIRPKGTSISSLTASATAMKVSVKKQTAQTTGYQLQYAANSKFQSAHSKASRSTTIQPGGLKLNQKYYVRVRTFKTVNGEKFYSVWSSPSSVTTKIPGYSGSAYIKLNHNKPTFSSKQITKRSYKKYSKLDSLGRSSVACACVGKDIMPTQKRGSTGDNKPTGWHSVKYDCLDGNYLYNVCHLIAYELTGDNADPKNLMTGTRYMNLKGMLPFENMVHDYVKSTGNHVMYRVTPVFKGKELLARGVQIEGYSVEDKGEDISFNVYCFNVQPNIKINYANGNSSPKAVKPAKTTGITVSGKTSGSVSLSWNRADRATAYYVFRYNASDGTYSGVGHTADTDYTVSGLSSGTSYTFMVQSYRKADGKETWGPYSERISATTKSSSGGGSQSYSESSSQTVYITETGSKYHRGGCRYLSKSSYAITLSQARNAGYSPCGVCCP